MTDHSERFSKKAAEYSKYRERYDPDIVLLLLRQWCGLQPEWRVADIGAGTGMVGDLFRANGNRVIAIEPNADMRAACATMHAADALFTTIEGSAEKTGLAGASIDMIAVGRALHWFDVAAALREFQRILKPRGWVAILACGRAEDGREENIALKALLQANTGRDQFNDPLLQVYRRLDKLFPGGQLHNAEVSGELHLDWNGLRGLTLSLSPAPMPDSEAFPAFESALRGYFHRFERNGKVTMTAKTWVSAGQFANY